MTGFMTRWVVLEEHEVGAADIDDDGSIRDASLERWVAAACETFLDCCAVLGEYCANSNLEVRATIPGSLSAARLGVAGNVVASASATEVHPDSFTIAVRVRGMHDAVINTSCVVTLEDPTTGRRHDIGDEVRDELIALAHAARHFN